MNQGQSHYIHAFGQASLPKQSLTALKVYDEIRRSCIQQVVESSLVIASFLTGRRGTDLEDLNKELLP